VILIDPVARAETSSKVFDVSPCGGARQGPSHSLIEPGSYHPVSWTVIHPSDGANCTLRLLQADLSYTPLSLYNEKTDANGWFPCARKETFSETVSVVIPQYVKCSECALQFICKTYQGSIYQCMDINLIGGVSQSCKGLCKNGGNCEGNLCKCKSSYSGSYCEYKIDNGEESGGLGIFIAFVLFLIIASVLLAAVFYWKNPDKMPKAAADLMAKFGSRNPEADRESVSSSKS
jgi:hypothetical protein